MPVADVAETARTCESERAPVSEPRAVCTRCLRPKTVCYCRHLTSIPTKTRVVLLQHPRERGKAIGTAHMASLCLPNSELHVGLRWDDSMVLQRSVFEAGRPVALLYPGEGAVDVRRAPRLAAITLVVVDGTWRQVHKVLRENPRLAALPRLTFEPPSPSEYRIRGEPSPIHVSTIEALAYALGALEGDQARLRRLLAPFRAMVGTQLAYEQKSRDIPSRNLNRRRKPRHDPIPECLRQRPDDVVCVLGEANAWSYRSPERARGVEDEIVHWVAQRLATGEVFDCVAAARAPLAPGTAHHVQLDVEQLRAGLSFAELVARWSCFARPTDVICSWGWYGSRVFTANGGRLPDTRVDLRQVARDLTKRKVGTIEECAALVGVSPDAPPVRGRAGWRLGHLTGIARYLIRGSAERQQPTSGLPRRTAPPVW